MRALRRNRRPRAGYTMIEMLIVVMYIAIMAMIVLPRVTGAGRLASEANLRATVQELRKAVASYQAETGLYPLSLDDLVATRAPDTGLTPEGVEVPILHDDFRGPYLITPGGGLPPDRSTGHRTWDYSTTPPNVGRVRSLSTGTSIQGEAYSSW